ncbi:hypothetical protein K438DRAFT_2101233 [Mycena galopus ATCC 62051]|nr:hypothetical protein K438DRAFT_2101233 [Mycena galopus ATCC 62051]
MTYALCFFALFPLLAPPPYAGCPACILFVLIPGSIACFIFCNTDEDDGTFVDVGRALLLSVSSNIVSSIASRSETDRSSLWRDLRRRAASSSSFSASIDQTFRCGSATCRARRFPIPGRLDASSKQNITTCLVFVLFFYYTHFIHFIANHLLLFFYSPDIVCSCTSASSLVPLPRRTSYNSHGLNHDGAKTRSGAYLYHLQLPTILSLHIL